MKATLDEGLSSALSDIVFWGERIGTHLSSITEERFLADGTLVDAVCFCISCIGEAAARVRRNWPDFAALNPDLELAHSSAMRNRIITDTSMWTIASSGRLRRFQFPLL